MSLLCFKLFIKYWEEPKKLRNRFGLEKFITDFIISGDVGMRKPDLAIFYLLIEYLQIEPQSSLFVDDNRQNLDSAASLGFETVIFKPVVRNSLNYSHKLAADFDQLKSFLS